MSLDGLKTGQGRRLYASATVESTFRTGTAPLTHIFEHTMESNHLQVKQNVIERGMTSGVLTDGPTRIIPNGYSLDSPFVLPASEISVPLFLAKAIGADQNTAGSHVMAWSRLPAKLPGMKLEDHISGANADADYDRLHHGICVNSFKFSATTRGVAKVSLGLKGSGYSEAGSNQTEAGKVNPSKFLTLSRCRLMMKACATAGTSAWDGGLAVGSIAAGAFPAVDSGSFTNVSEYLRSLEFEVNNGGDLEYEGGQAEATGQYCGAVMPGERVVSVRFSVRQGTPFAAMFRGLAKLTYDAQQEYTFLLDINSENANQAQMYAFPLCYPVKEPGNGTGAGVLEFDYEFRAKDTYTGSAYERIHALAVNGDNYDYC